MHPYKSKTSSLLHEHVKTWLLFLIVVLTSYSVPSFMDLKLVERANVNCCFRILVDFKSNILIEKIH